MVMRVRQLGTLPGLTPFEIFISITRKADMRDVARIQAFGVVFGWVMVDMTTTAIYYKTFTDQCGKYR